MTDLRFYDNQIKEAEASVIYWKRMKQEAIALKVKQKMCEHEWIDIPLDEGDDNSYQPRVEAYTKCIKCNKRKE